MLSRFYPPLALVLACVLIISSASAQTPSSALSDYIDLDRLRADGDDWEVMYENVAPENGRVTLYHNQWLMFFLHWRPLTDSMKELSSEYVVHHLLNFWGPSMPFTLSGTEGTTEVNGHKAYFVDATIYGRIKTRFIVWNCEETGRQFTSDCNVNIFLGTNTDYLELQDTMTHTICCHGTCPSSPTDADMELYRSDKYNLSFVKPAVWHTSEYQDPTWFPEGPSDTNGTLWTLLTDSEKHIDLAWRPKVDKLTPDVMNEMLQALVLDTTLGKDTAAISQYILDSAAMSQGRLYGSGTLGLHYKGEGEPYTDDFVFVSTLWNKGDRTYLLLVSAINTQNVWGRKVDLYPRAINLFRDLEVIPRVKVW